MFQENILDKITNLLKPVVERENFELIDVELKTEYGRRILRIFIDGRDGITVDDCAKISGKTGFCLDNNEDLQLGHYYLEVSSPGLDRVLKKESDFIKFTGHLINIKLNKPINGQKKFIGYLKECSNQKINIEEKHTGKIVDIDLTNILNAKRSSPLLLDSITRKLRCWFSKKRTSIFELFNTNCLLPLFNDSISCSRGVISFVAA